MDIRKFMKTFLIVFTAIVAFIGCDGGFDSSGFELFPCDGKEVCGVCAPKDAICCEAAGFDRDFPLICSGSTPVCCHVSGLSAFCAASQLECVNIQPPSPVVSSPELLTPSNHEIITQNNPNIGCPPDLDAGFGYSIFFDWTDSTSPNGIRGYRLIARYINAAFEFQNFTLIEAFVTNSEFEFVQCNRFQPDYRLTGFEWFVEAEDNLGNFNYSSGEAFEFQFEPCRFSDGRPCVDLP